ncbi:MAG: geranylgeranylglyceryl/heptaprenylglyceryl phosphate synthase, partial [Cytophagales bacterium]|nr:geranylgeranylglyceryl/heptaprenylglyceryl phosphate synthase [Cytophagales bacterium]
MAILKSLEQSRGQGKKSIAVLVDPDKVDSPSELDPLIRLANENCVDFFFVGGSLVTSTNLNEVIKHIKE